MFGTHTVHILTFPAICHQSYFQPSVMTIFEVPLILPFNGCLSHFIGIKLHTIDSD